MRIVVLCHYLRVAGGLSVGRNLARFLPDIGQKHKFLFFVPGDLGYEQILDNKANVEYVVVRIPNIIKRRIYDGMTLPRLIDKFQADVVFGAGNLGLKHPKCLQAILFHRSQLIYPLKYSKFGFKEMVRTWILKKSVAACLRKTNIVFCQTSVARERFAKTFKFPAKQIEIMPNAVSEFSKVSPETTKVPEVFHQKKTFDLFYLTKYYSHKNLEILIDIFRKHAALLKDVRCIITIAPNQTSAAAVLLKKIKMYSLQDKVINVGPLQQHELAGYFINSDALIFPTLLESFSSTYLEAMHFGLPILTSDLDFARYVCEDAALYFDPWKTSDIVDKIIALKTQPDMGRRLTESAKRRLSDFFKDWEEIVSDVLGQLEALYLSTNGA